MTEQNNQQNSPFGNTSNPFNTTSNPFGNSSNPFGTFSGFGTNFTSSNPFTFPTFSNPTPKTETEEPEGNKDLDDPEAEADIYFTPIIELKEVEQEKQIENEIFSERGLCAKYDEESSSFKERGRGEIKILQHPETKVTRIVLLRDQVLKLACNHFLMPYIQFKDVNSNEKLVQYTVVKDFALEEEQDKQITFVMRFNTPEAREKFVDICTKIQDEIKEKKNNEKKDEEEKK